MQVEWHCSVRMFGSHLISGGMHKGLLEAERLGIDCVQVFTKNRPLANGEST